MSHLWTEECQKCGARPNPEWLDHQWWQGDYPKGWLIGRYLNEEDPKWTEDQGMLHKKCGGEMATLKSIGCDRCGMMATPVLDDSSDDPTSWDQTFKSVGVEWDDDYASLDLCRACWLWFADQFPHLMVIRKKQLKEMAPKTQVQPFAVADTTTAS